MIKTLLLATDGSAQSLAATEYALLLAKAYGGRIKALSVLPHSQHVLQSSFSVNPLRFAEQESRADDEVSVRQVLEAVKRRALEEAVACTLQLAHGTPADCIVLEEERAELVVMGHRGHDRDGCAEFLGSTAEAVLGAASKPLLLCPGRYAPITRVLACFDGSVHALRALHLAANLVGKLGVSLDVIAVHRRPAVAEALLEEAREYLGGEVAFEGHIRQGHAAAEILAQAEESGDNLIAMGTYGHSTVRYTLIGSTTEAVMREITVPLLITR